MAMEVVFSVFFSGIVVSDNNKYGPIGIIFALLSYLIAVGVVVISAPSGAGIPHRTTA